MMNIYEQLLLVTTSAFNWMINMQMHGSEKEMYCLIKDEMRILFLRNDKNFFNYDF